MEDLVEHPRSDFWFVESCRREYFGPRRTPEALQGIHATWGSWKHGSGALSEQKRDEYWTVGAGPVGDEETSCGKEQKTSAS